MLDEVHYYPNGLKMEGYWMNSDKFRYTFNSIEAIDDFGLNVNRATFRTLDSELGRWWSVDPQAANLMELSPYNSMNNSPIKYNDPNGDLAWFVPVAIGAAIGGLGGGAIASNQGESFWKGFTTGANIGGGIGLGTTFGLSGTVGNISGIYTGGLKSSTLGWNIVSNALITSNINIASSFLQGRNFDSIFNSGLVGLTSGAIGGGLGGKFDGIGKGLENRFFSDRAIKATNLITAALNGFGDRYIHSKSNRESRSQALRNGLFGLGEGLYLSHFIGNKFVGLKGSYGNVAYRGLTGRYISALISQGATSVPGLGYSVAYWHNAIAAGYNAIKSPILGFGLLSGFVGNSYFAINNYRDTYTRAIIGPENLWPF